MKYKKTYQSYQDDYYDDNFKWKLKDIAYIYKYENPSWSWSECWKKARLVYRELKNMNARMWNDNKNYYKFFKPFSFYESEDGEWSTIRELEEV